MEENYRFQVFVINLDKLKTIQENNDDPYVEFGITKFYDWTDEEFDKVFTLDPKYFKMDEKPRNKLYDTKNFVSKQLYDQDGSWLNEFMENLINRDDFDFFKEVLKNKKVPDHQRVSYEQYQLQNLFNEFVPFNVDVEIQDIMSHIGEHYAKVHQEHVKQAKEEGRRLQDFFDPFLSSNVNYVYKVPMYLNRINELYWMERENEKENENYKNPFDKIDNSYPEYDEYNMKRDSKKTIDLDEKRPYTDTVWIDGIEIPAEVNWNDKEPLSPVKD